MSFCRDFSKLLDFKDITNVMKYHFGTKPLNYLKSFRMKRKCTEEEASFQNWRDLDMMPFLPNCISLFIIALFSTFRKQLSSRKKKERRKSLLLHFLVAWQKFALFVPVLEKQISVASESWPFWPSSANVMMVVMQNGFWVTYFNVLPPLHLSLLLHTWMAGNSVWVVVQQ